MTDKPIDAGCRVGTPWPQPEGRDEASCFYFWLGRVAADDAEQERFDAAFALWAYNLDGSEAERKFREIRLENKTESDMATHKFTIRAPLDGRNASVEIDGKPLKGVCRVSFDVNANNRPSTLYLQVVGEVEVDGEFREEDIVYMRRPLL